MEKDKNILDYEKIISEQTTIILELIGKIQYMIDEREKAKKMHQELNAKLRVEVDELLTITPGIIEKVIKAKKFSGKSIHPKAEKVARILEEEYQKKIEEGLGDKEAKRQILYACKNGPFNKANNRRTLRGEILFAMGKDEGEKEVGKNTLIRYWTRFFPKRFEATEE